MSINLKDTDFFKSVKNLLQLRINQNIERKIADLIIQISKVLTDRELGRINLSELEELAKRNKFVRINLCTYQLKKPRTKKMIQQEKRCMARIGLGSQCTRSKTINSDYCQSHTKSLPYGRIDGPVTENFKLTQRRGRKSNTKKAYSLEELQPHLSKYIQATIINIDDNVLIQDENGLLYTYDSENRIIGRIIDDKIVWY